MFNDSKEPVVVSNDDARFGMVMSAFTAYEKLVCNVICYNLIILSLVPRGACYTVFSPEFSQGVVRGCVLGRVNNHIKA